MYQNNNIIHTDDEGRQQKQKTEIGSPAKERDRERIPGLNEERERERTLFRLLGV